MVFAGIVFLLGCLTLGFSLLLAAVLPHAFLVYLTAHPASFGHDILYPDMTGPYVLAALEMALGLAGLLYVGLPAKK